MEQIKLPQASVLTSPNPVSIVCTQKPDGTTNLATVSWWTYLSFNPGMIAYAMAKTSYSGEMVRQNKEVILSIPGAEIADAIMGQIPLHSRVAIQCGLKEFIETGDHYLYICDVNQVYGNKNEQAVFSWDGYAKIAPANQG